MGKRGIYIDVEIIDSVNVRLEDSNVVEYLNQCTAAEISEIMSRCNASHEAPEFMETSSLIDKMKYDLLVDAFKKYSIFELEEKLK